MPASSIRIADRQVGDGQPCFIIAELGINHNGCQDLARQLIDAASSAGCDAVKFQKRTLDVVYTPEDLARPRKSAFGTTNGDLKEGLEFGRNAYDAIDARCRDAHVLWTASCWDEASVDFIAQYDPPFFKIASPCLTDDNLLKHHRRYGKPIVLSTGMSTLEEIDHAVSVLGTTDLLLMHCTSVYPSQPDDLHLSVIPKLRERYNVPVGYSGHEVGLATSLAAAVMGACMIERHLTLDRAMWGSDQAASVEPQGLRRLIRDIRSVETAMGNAVKRVHDGEKPIMEKLRRKRKQ
jgi:N-acetylneuraminate synthase